MRFEFSAFVTVSAENRLQAINRIENALEALHDPRVAVSLDDGEPVLLEDDE